MKYSFGIGATVALIAIAIGPALRAQDPIKPQYPPVAPQHSASEVLELAAHTLETAHTVEYTVRKTPPSPSQSSDPGGRTVVLGAIGLPFRYHARFQSGRDAAVELAVSDGQKVRISAGGKLREYPTRVMEDRASADALPTLGAFDPDTYRKALAGRSAIYAGQDDIEGDRCYVVALPSLFADEVGGDTHYYWISAQSGLPRSTQTYRIVLGRTFLTYRWILSDIHLNPDVTAETFRYRPTAADSLTATEETPRPGSEERAVLSLVGKQVPDLEVRDLDYKPLSLAQVAKGKATIVTLWATWCGPCIGEFPVFESVLEAHRGELQVVALATQDSRLNVVNFARKHPEYHFIFLTDPNLEDPNSEIAKFFAGQAVPRNVWIEPDGKIDEYLVGAYEDKPDEFREKVANWLAGFRSAH